MFKSLKNMALCACVAVVALSGCGRNMDSTVYQSSSPSGKVLQGTVISAKAVKIKDSERLSDNAVGGIGGGLIGGILGSEIGRGKGNAIATVGGVVAGAVAGAAAEDHLSTTEGMEYVVRIDSAQKKRTKSKTRKIKTTDGSVDQDVSDSVSVTETETDLISVVQGDDVVFRPGQRVLIIYNNDRPRLSPLY
jgi:outer membrane lipoprotein SlyB